MINNISKKEDRNKKKWNKFYGRNSQRKFMKIIVNVQSLEERHLIKVQMINNGNNINRT